MGSVEVNTPVEDFTVVRINGVGFHVWMRENGEMDISIHDNSKFIKQIKIFDKVGAKFTKKSRVSNNKTYQCMSITRVE